MNNKLEEKVFVRVFKSKVETNRFNKNQKVWIVHLFGNHAWVVFEFRGSGRYVNGVIDLDSKAMGREYKWVEVDKSFAKRLYYKGMKGYPEEQKAKDWEASGHLMYTECNNDWVNMPLPLSIFDYENYKNDKCFFVYKGQIAKCTLLWSGLSDIFQIKTKDKRAMFFKAFQDRSAARFLYSNVQGDIICISCFVTEVEVESESASFKCAITKTN